MYTATSGDRYKGEWHAGKTHGDGKATSSTGRHTRESGEMANVMDEASYSSTGIYTRESGETENVMNAASLSPSPVKDTRANTSTTRHMTTPRTRTPTRIHTRESGGTTRDMDAANICGRVKYMRVKFD